MTRYFLTAVLLCLLGFNAAWAETYSASSDSVDICADLDNMLADYKAGKDVDLNKFEHDGKIVRIPVEVDSLKKLGVSDANLQGLDAKAYIGMMELHPDGTLALDGQVMNPEALRILCNAGSQYLQERQKLLEAQQ